MYRLNYSANYLLIMKYLICFLSLFIFFGTNTSSMFSQDQKKTPVIVELFTSEGCSSCPPADKFLQKLVQEQPIKGVEIIALSEHVDYWNHLGWTDKFSSAQFSNRQKYYASFFKREEIYTPQMVIDGTLEFRVKEGTKSFDESAGKPKGDIDIKFEKVKENTILLNVTVKNLPQISSNDRTLVFVAITENNLDSNILKGENSGLQVKHVAVTRFLKNIGDVENQEANLSTKIELGKKWKRDELNIVAFVQEAKGRRILGAAKIIMKD